MSLHRYSSVVRRIDQRGGSLAKFLATDRHPMDLRAMIAPADASQTLRQGVEELATRTARCYRAFSHPVIARSLSRANAERLRWVRTYSLREFKYCVALQDAASKFVASGGLTSLTHTNRTVGSSSGSPATEAQPPSSSSSPSFCFLRNTDDLSYVDKTSAAVSTSLPQPRAAGPEESIYHAAPMSSAGGHPNSTGGCTASAFLSSSAPLSREQAEVKLETGDIELTDLPFDLALEMLRPQESVLDVLVNEAALQSDQLNNWFSRFCRRRVAWRVLHEHLLHIVRPDINPRVVSADTDLVAVLQSAAATVADIYAKMGVCDSELVIHIEEDSAILSSPPMAASVSSSVDCETRVCKAGERLPVPPALPEPPVSLTIYSVDGHLMYIFREILKNACVATVRWTSDVSVTVRFAVDERWAIVDFIDNAGGITVEHMKNIWKFGWTTSEHYESHLGGFGVGLPTSKVYVDTWGGSIDVYSTEGKGTTVRVRYPKAPTEVMVREPTANNSGQ